MSIVTDGDATDLTAVEKHRDLVVGAEALNLAKGRWPVGSCRPVGDVDPASSS